MDGDLRRVRVVVSAQIFDLFKEMGETLGREEMRGQRASRMSRGAWEQWVDTVGYAKGSLPSRARVGGDPRLGPLTWLLIPWGGVQMGKEISAENRMAVH